MSVLRPGGAPMDTSIDGMGLAAAIGARVHVDVTIPRTEIRGRMRLITRLENSEARGAARKVLKDNGIPTDIAQLNAPTVIDEWNNEIAVQTLARAVRDPKDQRLQLAPIEDWREALDDDQIAALYLEYKDLATRLDPIGSKGELSPHELTAITQAAKKKDVDLLMSYGSLKLALFMATSDAPPSS